MLCARVEIPKNFDEVSVDAFIDYISHLGLLGPVCLYVGDGLCLNFDDAATMNTLKRSIRAAPCFIEGLELSHCDGVTELLNLGLRIAFFAASAANLKEDQNDLIQAISGLPIDRVGVSIHQSIIYEFESVSFVDLPIFASSIANILLLSGGLDLDTCLGQRKAISAKYSSTKNIFMFAPNSLSTEILGQLLSEADERTHLVVAPALIPAAETGAGAGQVTSSMDTLSSCSPLPCPMSQGLNSKDYIGVFIASLKTDRTDGLFTTVVCDEMGVCLGLVYSNALSIRTAICEKRGVYWSRSRGNLWRKGLTSGANQILLGVDVDAPAAQADAAVPPPAPGEAFLRGGARDVLLREDYRPLQPHRLTHVQLRRPVARLLELVRA